MGVCRGTSFGSFRGGKEGERDEYKEEDLRREEEKEKEEERSSGSEGGWKNRCA